MNTSTENLCSTFKKNKSMKKIVLLLVPFTISFAVIAQDSETKTKPAQKNSSQKSETKSESKALLDGKSFKITLTQKDESMSSTPAGTEKNQNAAIAERYEEDKTKTTVQTKEPVENPELRQSPQDYADWSNAKGKLQFNNGMLKLSLNNKEIATDNCAYNVTSGTADFATFSASCKLSPTAALGNSSTRDNASSQTGVESNAINRNENNMGGTDKDRTTVKSESISPENPDDAYANDATARQESPRPDDRTALNKQPAPSNTEQPEMNGVQETSKQKELNQDQEMKPAKTSPARININGFVNGGAVTGTIVLYDNGKTNIYSFSGSSTGKKDAESLGLNK
jgi:hypothetical protein